MPRRLGRVSESCTIRAAGTLPWRRTEHGLQVALVHRPRYDDWSWPKGKLDPGECFATAAVRETREETGLRVRLGRSLPSAHYLVREAPKEVRYWAAEVLTDDGALEHEVDEVAWLAPSQARARLTHPRDIEQLDHLVDFDACGALSTWPLAVVRHAHAIARGDWSGPDPKRPLDALGRQQSAAVSELLAAYRPERLLSSPSTRTADTLRPYAERSGQSLRDKRGLSEEGHARHPEKASQLVRKAFRRGQPAALCSHGPVLPALLTPLAEIADEVARQVLVETVRVGLPKGHLVLAHLTGDGDDARVVEVEVLSPADA